MEMAKGLPEADDAPLSDEILAREIVAKYHISDSRFRDVRQAFRSYDVDNKGIIGQKELADSLKRCGIEANDDEIHAIVTDLTGSEDGTISFSQFVEMVGRKTSHMHDILKEESPIKRKK